MNNLTAIIIAIIGAGGPGIWLLDRFDKRNTAQHASNMELLQTIHSNVDKLGEGVDELQTDVKDLRNDLYDHLSFHAHKETKDGITGRTGTNPAA